MLPPRESIRQYCTWLPAMMDLLLRTSGPVLELGSGFGTPILKAYCQQAQRHLTTVETDPEWWSLLEGKSDQYHTVLQSLPAEGEWDIVLVDSAPNTTRQPYIEALKNRVRFMVVHDTEPGNYKGYGYKLEQMGFAHISLWNDLMPHTSVVTVKA